MRDYAYFGQLGWRTRLLNRFRGLFRTPFLERWLRDRTQDRTAASFWVKLMPPEYIYPKGSWRTFTHDGLTLRLDLSNTVDHAVYFGYADEGDEHLAQRIRPDHTIIDVGGNIGFRALKFGRLVPQGRVVSFEPDPENFIRLRGHLDMNDATNVTPVELGIGPEERTFKLYRVVESNPGMNRILPEGEGRDRFSHKEVRVAPLSTALEGTGVVRVDVIKVDVEGFELAVLKGSEDVLRRDRPLLFVELDDDNLLENGTSARALIDWLKGLGYRVNEAVTDTPVPDDRDLAHCHFDILCAHSGS